MAARREDINGAVQTAFAREMAALPWFTNPYVQQVIDQFVGRFDQTFTRWRREYTALTAEREEINRRLLRETSDRALQYRRTVIEDKLAAMREGKKDFYTYRYLGGQGFLPNYAFPRQAVTLSFREMEDELSRDPVIALSEYAPGNFVYYRGNRYEVVEARPATQENQADFTRLLVCPACRAAYLGEETNRAICGVCGQNLTRLHPHLHALPMPDMVARRRQSITADDEERMRRGYQIDIYYRPGTRTGRWAIASAQQARFELTYEHNGRLVIVNWGSRQSETNDALPGFAYCQRCQRWLTGERAVQEHPHTPGQPGDCPRSGRPEELVGDVVLFNDSRHDVITLTVPPPAEFDGAQVEAFYTTLLHTLVQAIAVAMELDAGELGGFVVERTNEPGGKAIVLYETAEGGSGAVASLINPARLAEVVSKAIILLHGEEDTGCERACYECLCTFYNQRDHHLLDRQLVLPWLRSLTALICTPLESDTASSPSLPDLLAQCESELERAVLRAIAQRGLPLPDAVQKPIYEGDIPVARADLFYLPNPAVFIDGPPHDQDYVQALDAATRRHLQRLNYRPLVIRYDARDAGLAELAQRLGINL
ncbi:MAG: hypothetical protein FOGNACKC_06318 [Anaerolineae bacterium]|nr:hypothetical protein [Anaerolineae bacterium]